MARRRISILLSALLLLGIPATALADGAGDEQYEDPLVAPAAPKKKPKKPTRTGTPTTAPASGTAPASSSGSTAPAASAAPAAASELPRTGIPAAYVALTGFTMIGAGVSLRRRVVPR